MCYLLLVLSAIDLDVLRLPNKLVATLALAGLAAAGASQIWGMAAAPLTVVEGALGEPLVASLVGAALGGGISLLIALTYRGVRGKSGFGMGDVKLLLALGPYLGVYNVGVLFLGSVIGAVWGIIVSARSKEGMSAKIPFGPSLAAAAILIAFFGPDLWLAYARLVGLA